MSFTNKDFPQRVFESLEEFYECIKTRDEIKKKLNEDPVDIVKIKQVIKKKDSVIRQWILKYIKELQSQEEQKKKSTE